LNCDKSLSQAGRFLPEGSELGPCRKRRFSASCVESPDRVCGGACSIPLLDLKSAAMCLISVKETNLSILDFHQTCELLPVFKWKYEAI
jgi:hypothetical protein